MQSLKYQEYFLNIYHSHINTCARIPTIIFLYQHVLLFHFGFELRVVLFNLHLQSHEIRFIIVFDSFLFVIIVNSLTFMSFVFFETYF